MLGTYWDPENAKKSFKTILIANKIKMKFNQFLNLWRICTYCGIQSLKDTSDLKLANFLCRDCLHLGAMVL